MITIAFTLAGMLLLLLQNALMGFLDLLAEARAAVPTHPTQVFPDHVYETN